MAKLSNTPRQQMTFDLERRKSYSFRCVLLHADRFPLDLTGCTLRFVMKREEYDEDLFDTTNQLINSEALILSPESGEGTFSFQAAELDGPPGAYNYAIVLWTKDGYSVVVTKGTVNLHPNTDSLSIMQSYTTNTADAALEITLRGNDVLNIVTNTLTRSEARVEIIGTGRPDDAATLEANTINEVANARVGTLFISLDGAGINAWAWRKRRDGWYIVEDANTTWDEVLDKPLDFPASAHSHPWGEVLDKPLDFPASAHSHPWGEITGKPTKFLPVEHTHTWAELTDVPAAFTPAVHTHAWTAITGKPAAFIPSPHNHMWVDLTDVPLEFPPAGHEHSWAEITGVPTTFPPATHSHAWVDITGKPTTFAPAAHSHSWTETTGKPATFPPAAHAHAWGEITGKPTTFAPAAHSHSWTEVTDRPTLGTAAATASTDYATAAQGAKADTALQPATGQAINAQTGTTYTLVAADAGKLVTLANAAAITLTVPGSVFTAGQRVDVLVLGAGMVTAAGSSCAVNGTPSLVSRAQYSAFTVLFTSTTTAVVVGDLASA